MDLTRLGTRARPTLGLDTFGDVPLDHGRETQHAAEVIRQVVEEGVLADRVGVDYLGLGEHHRPDFAISAPDVVLAAIAGRTERIRLGTGVTVLSSDDPIRVHQRFATLDAIAPGRAEVQLGRGSFVESFALFGHSLEDYDRLFAEKLDLFAAVQAADAAASGEADHGAGRGASHDGVTWEGTIRPPLDGVRVHPATEHGLPAWIAVGGTPESVVRAARYAMPLVLAVIGGSPRAFVQFADLYRQALSQFGHPELPVGMHSPGHVAATDEEAREQMFPHQAEQFTKIGRERGWGGPYTRQVFDAAAEPEGALFVGSPETVARKIAWACRALGLSRFQLKYAVNGLPSEQRRESIRLYGEEVIPRVRELLAQEEES